MSEAEYRFMLYALEKCELSLKTRKKYEDKCKLYEKRDLCSNDL